MIVSSSEGTYKYKFKLSYEGHEYEPTLLSSSLRDNGNRLKAKIELPWGTGTRNICGISSRKKRNEQLWNLLYI